MNKIKISTLSLFIIAFAFSGALPQAKAQSNNNSTDASVLLQQVQTLLQQVKALQDQIAELNQKQAEVRQELNQTLQLTRSLSRGMSGEEVELLQKILSTDPEIYPEGLVTGYYGPLTEKAVQKFQRKANIEQVGIVGPQTRARINFLLTEGAGNSEQVPPGLLIAPGIRKKLSEAPTIPPGQKLPPGIAKKLGFATTTPPGDDEEEDITPPIIFGIFSTSTTATSTIIKWMTNESADSKLWYSLTIPVNVNNTTSTTMLSDSTLVTSHNLSITGLSTSTVYYYIVSSADASGNRSTSTEASFATLSE